MKSTQRKWAGLRHLNRVIKARERISILFSSLFFKISVHLGGMEKMSLQEWKVLMGARKGGPKLPRKIFTQRVTLPDNFDARTQWVSILI
jgi:hypothetical protein